LFFGRDGETDIERAARERKAKTVCAGCRVRSDCLDYAIYADERDGVWGGFGETDLTNLRKSRAAQARRVRARATARKAAGAGLKRCGGKCGKVKPLAQFDRLRRSPDGYRGVCKACTSVTKNAARAARARKAA
jgi:WhiB family redox-sensing transcriptional regulator